jgi:Uma2 family endonuclease
MSAPTPALFGGYHAFRRFSVAEYHRLIEVGILKEGDRVELLEGFVIVKKEHTPPHDAAIQKGNKGWLRLLPPGWDVRVQSAVTLTESEPEPDFAIVRGNETAYLNCHPSAADVGLVVEVSDSTLPGDRHDKGRIYARVGIPRYWIVNLPDGLVEVYTAPSGPTADPCYAHLQNYRPGDLIPLPLDGVVVAQVPAQDLIP